MINYLLPRLMLVFRSYNKCNISHSFN